MMVITGATGNVGRPLVRALAAAGEEVTAVARRISAADVPAGVRCQRADLAEPRSLEPALEGAESLFVLLSGEQLVTQHPDAAELFTLAAKAGVRRIVLLSSQGAGTRPDLASHSRLRAVEEALKETARVETTILRPGGFASNTYGWAESIRARGIVAAPFGDVALPVVDPLDIALSAAAILRERGTTHAGRTYVLTGPAAVTPREQTHALAEALGGGPDSVRFVEQTPAEARAAMLRFLPEEVVAGTLAILGRPLPAEQRVSPHVEELLGRPPRAYAEWVADNLEAFRAGRPGTPGHPSAG